MDTVADIVQLIGVKGESKYGEFEKTYQNSPILPMIPFSRSQITSISLRRDSLITNWFQYREQRNSLRIRSLFRFKATLFRCESESISYLVEKS